LTNSLRIKYYTNPVSLSVTTNKIYVKGMTCSHCVESVKNSLNKIKEISDLVVDLDSGLVQYSSEDDLAAEVKENILSLGYKIK